MFHLLGAPLKLCNYCSRLLYRKCALGTASQSDQFQRRRHLCLLCHLIRIVAASGQVCVSVEAGAHPPLNQV